MILVTGATGQYGSLVIRGLLDRFPTAELAVSVRDPERAEHLAAQGVRVRRGDFADPASLTNAFAGADQVLIVPGTTLGEAGVAQHRTAIDAAYGAGAERVLYAGHQAASRPGSQFGPARDHAAVEAHLAASEQPWTALRNGYYAESLIGHHLGDAAQTGELARPADGKVAWTSRADLAEAAAAILAGDARFDGPTPPLTASDAVDLEDVARMLAETTGRAVRRSIVEDEAFVAGLVAQGTPERFARMFLGTYLAARAGEFAVTDPTLRELIGHEPRSVRDAVGHLAGEGPTTIRVPGGAA